MFVLQALFQHPAALACTLAAFAAAVPCAISVLLLAASLITLAAQQRAGAAAARWRLGRSWLLLLLLAWMTATYISFAAGWDRMLPTPVKVAFLVTDDLLLSLRPLLMPYLTLLFVAAAAACAAQRRSVATNTLWSTLLQRVDMQQLGSPPARPGAAAPSQQAPAPRPMGRGGPPRMGSEALHVAFAIFVLGKLLVPAGWLSLSVLNTSAASTVYAAGPLLPWCAMQLAASSSAEPTVPQASRASWLGPYAAAHAMAMVAVFLVQAHVPRAAVKALTGTHSISMRRDVAPLIAMAMLAAFHSMLGSVLLGATGGISTVSRRDRPAAQADPAPEGGLDSISVPLLASHNASHRPAATDQQPAAAARCLERRWRPAFRAGGHLASALGVPGS